MLHTSTRVLSSCLSPVFASYWFSSWAQPTPLISPASPIWAGPYVPLTLVVAVASPVVPAPNLSVTGYSSDQTVISDHNIRIEPSFGTNILFRKVTLYPTPNWVWSDLVSTAITKFYVLLTRYGVDDFSTKANKTPI